MSQPGYDGLLRERQPVSDIWFWSPGNHVPGKRHPRHAGVLQPGRAFSNCAMLESIQSPRLPSSIRTADFGLASMLLEGCNMCYL